MLAFKYRALLTYLPTLPCIVVEIVGKACTMYHLCCKVGVLNTCYGAGDMTLFTGVLSDIDVDDIVPMSAGTHVTRVSKIC